MFPSKIFFFTVFIILITGMLRYNSLWRCNDSMPWQFLSTNYLEHHTPSFKSVVLFCVPYSAPVPDCHFWLVTLTGFRAERENTVTTWTSCLALVHPANMAVDACKYSRTQAAEAGRSLFKVNLGYIKGGRYSQKIKLKLKIKSKSIL